VANAQGIHQPNLASAELGFGGVPDFIDKQLFYLLWAQCGYMHGFVVLIVWLNDRLVFHCADYISEYKQTQGALSKNMAAS